jgi:hypothetical protein
VATVFAIDYCAYSWFVLYIPGMDTSSVQSPKQPSRGGFPPGVSGYPYGRESKAKRTARREALIARWLAPHGGVIMAQVGLVNRDQPREPAEVVEPERPPEVSAREMINAAIAEAEAKRSDNADAD